MTSDSEGKEINVLSLFSGVGGLDLGLERAGMRIVAQCEIEPYPRRVLARHWPDVPCYEDVSELADSLHAKPARRGSRARRRDRLTRVSAGHETADLSGVHLVCGGFPCQDLSVAGRRAGLAGSRSGLFFDAARVADAVLGDGGWILIENVPGLLSSNNGRDFAVVLATLAELGFHDLAWRVLDSRFFGVPQRRRRVFILARRARGRRSAEVLLEPESGGGDFAPSRKARAHVAATLTRGANNPGSNAAGRRQEDDENLVANTLDRQRGGADDNAAQGNHLVSPTVTSKWRNGSGGPAGDECQNLVAHLPRTEGFDGAPADPDRVREIARVAGRVDDRAISVRTGQGGANGLGVSGDATPTVDGTGAGAVLPPVGAFMAGQGAKAGGIAYEEGVAPTLKAAGSGSNRAPTIVGQADGDGRCALDPKPDGPRYAACGNAVTVNVAEWIGRRIMQVETERGS